VSKIAIARRAVSRWTTECREAYGVLHRISCPQSIGKANNVPTEDNFDVEARGWGQENDIKIELTFDHTPVYTWINEVRAKCCKKL
jgi:hypothetical protein